jgi:hypothetical protein
LLRPKAQQGAAVRYRFADHYVGGTYLPPKISGQQAPLFARWWAVAYEALRPHQIMQPAGGCISGYVHPMPSYRLQ